MSALPRTADAACSCPHLMAEASLSAWALTSSAIFRLRLRRYSRESRPVAGAIISAATAPTAVPARSASDRRAAAGRDGWSQLRDAALWARVLRVAREDIAYFKFLFESYEGVAIIRTVETLPDGAALIAVLATADFVHETDAILDDVRERGAPAFAGADLPAVCNEDWFLSTWVREAGDE